MVNRGASLRRLVACFFAGWLANAAVAAEPPELRTADLGRCDLLNGAVLEPCSLAYRVAGPPLDSGAPVMLFPTWYTGVTADLWNYGYVGPGAMADTNRYSVVLVEALANGVSASPSNHPAGVASFPDLAIGDMVNSQYRLLTESLNVKRVDVVLGVSMGGMQALDWAVRYPSFMGAVVAIEGTPWPTAWDQLSWDGMIDTMAAFDGTESSRIATSRQLSRLEAQVLWSPDYFVSMVGERDAAAWLDDFDPGLSGGKIHDNHAQLRAARAHDVGLQASGDRAAAARRVQARLLVAVFAKDQYVHPAPSLVFAEVAGGERWLSQTPCGHMGPNAECEQALVRERVHAFLAGAD